MGDKSTNINDLPYKKQAAPSAPINRPPQAMSGNGPPNPINTAGDAGIRPAQAFAQVPALGHDGPTIVKPDSAIDIGGPSQGMSAPLKPVQGKKEFFGLKDTDYKSTIVVFALVLIFSSNIVFELMKVYLPSVMSSDNKVTLVGSLIAALVAALIFIIIKAVAGI